MSDVDEFRRRPDPTLEIEAGLFNPKAALAEIDLLEGEEGENPIQDFLETVIDPLERDEPIVSDAEEVDIFDEGTEGKDDDGAAMTETKVGN